MKKYPNKHYESHDERWAAKRALEAQMIANEPKFCATLYLNGESALFFTEADYTEALKHGWTDGMDGNSPATEAMLKPKRTRKAKEE